PTSGPVPDRLYGADLRPPAGAPQRPRRRWRGRSVAHFTEFSLSGFAAAATTRGRGGHMPTAEDKRALGLLRKADVLSDISPEALQLLLPSSKVGTYRPRQVIYLPGDRAQGVHFLASGRIKVSKVTRDGKELTL